QVEEFDDIVDALAGALGRHAVEVRGELEELAAGELVVEEGLIGNVADELPGLVALGSQVVTADANTAAGGNQQAAEYFDGGGLAGAVGAETGEEFASRHTERQIADGEFVAEALRHSFEFDHGYSSRS